MKTAAFASRLHIIADRLRNDRSGVAALEFALILPFMLLMYFGTAELTKGILVNRKLTLAARSVSDLLAQSAASINDTTATQIFSAGSAMMGTDATGLKMTLSSIKFSLKNGSTTIYDAKTAWSVTMSGNPLRPCTVLTKDTSSTMDPDVNTVPAGFYTGPGSIVVADITYSYPSPFNINTSFYKSPATLVFTRAYFNTPRNTNTIGYTGSAGTICP